MLVTQGDEDQLSHEDQLFDSGAAHLICLKHTYIPIDVQRTRYWEGNPNPFSPLSTVVLRHRDYPHGTPHSLVV